MSFEFTITCAISSQKWDVELISNTLFDAGCDDATVFTGLRGTIGLTFDRVSDSAEMAISSAIEDVKSAYPEAEILEVKPDLVSLTYIAEMLGQSRQNIRKLTKFPPPIITGSNPLWHLYQVIRWYENRGSKPFHVGLSAVTKAAWNYNFMLEKNRLQQY
ncbi:MAG: DNA-binding protein [Magnetococcales bacterium]|nr:DNA-binding protein [Magnetococcales bacterium]